MAFGELALLLFPIPLQPPTKAPPKVKPSKAVVDATSPLTPLSAVAPPCFLPISRLQIQVTLETIFEEETSEQETEASSTSSAMFSAKKSACFLEMKMALPPYHNNCRCA